jgi:hypothetical protein
VTAASDEGGEAEIEVAALNFAGECWDCTDGNTSSAPWPSLVGTSQGEDCNTPCEHTDHECHRSLGLACAVQGGIRGGNELGDAAHTRAVAPAACGRTPAAQARRTAHSMSLAAYTLAKLRVARMEPVT